VTSWFRTLSSRVLLDHPFVQVREDQLESPSGEMLARTVIDQGDAVGILPLFDDGTVAMVRQYRHALGTEVLEIPAGKLDVEGEEVEACAARELAEEVGLAAASWEHLTTFANSAGGTTERTHLYLATGLSVTAAPDGFQPKAEEAHMEVARLPLAELVAAARSGTIIDAKTVIALLLAAERA
jgi:ADP-ribose pyrophosphatase